MDEVKNVLVDLEEKTEGKSLKKQRSATKAGTTKTDATKTDVTKADVTKADATNADAAKTGTSKTGTSKAGARKATKSKTAVTKVDTADSNILNIQENEQGTNIPVSNNDKILTENFDFGQLFDNNETGKKNGNERQEEEIENMVRDATQEDETKKKNPRKRKLCKLIKKNYLKKHFSEYEELVLNPRYICGKCGRVAKDAKSLCKPMLIKE